MRLRITVKPNSRRPGVEVVGPDEMKVAVNAPPQEGKANAAVIEVLAGHFKVPKSAVRITHGLKGKTKVVEIDETLLKK